MAIKSVESIIDHKPKRTSQGGKKPKMSSMNKDKRRTYKKYRVQGRGK